MDVSPQIQPTIPVLKLADSTKNIIAGTTAGFVGKLFDHPFDTIKVLLQTQSTHAPTYRNAWHCFQVTVQSEAGFSSLYRGISAPLLGGMVETSMVFWGYSHCKAALGETPDHRLSLGEYALAGAGAGFLAPIVMTPVELVKCRLQVQNAVGEAAAMEAATGAHFQLYKGPIDVIVKTIKQEGFFRGLYKGNLSTLAREVPGNCVWYGTYEAVCHAMIPEGGTKADLGPSSHWLGGALAGAGYWTAFYPADTVKSVIQTATSEQQMGILETFAEIYKKEGIRGLYRGWGVTVARSAPSNGLIFVVYEYTQKLLKDRHHAA